MPAARPGRELPPQREYRTAPRRGGGRNRQARILRIAARPGSGSELQGRGVPCGLRVLLPLCFGSQALRKATFGAVQEGSARSVGSGWLRAPRCRRRRSAGPAVPAQRCERRGTFDQGGELIRAVPLQNHLASTFFFFF